MKKLIIICLFMIGCSNNDETIYREDETDKIIKNVNREQNCDEAGVRVQISSEGTMWFNCVNSRRRTAEQVLLEEAQECKKNCGRLGYNLVRDRIMRSGELDWRCHCTETIICAPGESVHE